MKYAKLATLLLMFVCYTALGQNKSESQAPNKMVRAIIQDKKGNIWLAGADGIIRYDGKSFSNTITKIKPARFFSALEDRKENLWFTAVGSGVYHYKGESFKNYTTKDGFLSDLVTNVYEDKTGGIWFGSELGASRYDGKTFRNFKLNEQTAGDNGGGGDSVHVSGYQQDNDVNTIIEDNTGKFWFGTRGNTFTYDGKTFTRITHKDEKAFVNVRSIIKDKKGNIWLGGNGGLWRYDGNTFTNITPKFVGNIMEDKKGNIWTSSESALNKNWALTRYDQNSLSGNKLVGTEILSIKGMLFGLLEANDGSIWVGALNGVYRYDGTNVTDFK